MALVGTPIPFIVKVSTSSGPVENALVTISIDAAPSPLWASLLASSTYNYTNAAGFALIQTVIQSGVASDYINGKVPKSNQYFFTASTESKKSQRSQGVTVRNEVAAVNLISEPPRRQLGEVTLYPAIGGALCNSVCDNFVLNVTNDSGQGLSRPVKVHVFRGGNIVYGALLASSALAKSSLFSDGSGSFKVNPRSILFDPSLASGTYQLRFACFGISSPETVSFTIKNIGQPDYSELTSLTNFVYILMAVSLPLFASNSHWLAPIWIGIGFVCIFPYMCIDMYTNVGALYLNFVKSKVASDGFDAFFRIFNVINVCCICIGLGVVTFLQYRFSDTWTFASERQTNYNNLVARLVLPEEPLPPNLVSLRSKQVADAKKQKQKELESGEITAQEAVLAIEARKTSLNEPLSALSQAQKQQVLENHEALYQRSSDFYYPQRLLFTVALGLIISLVVLCYGATLIVAAVNFVFHCRQRASVILFQARNYALSAVYTAQGLIAEPLSDALGFDAQSFANYALNGQSGAIADAVTAVTQGDSSSSSIVSNLRSVAKTVGLDISKLMLTNDIVTSFVSFLLSVYNVDSGAMTDELVARVAGSGIASLVFTAVLILTAWLLVCRQYRRDIMHLRLNEQSRFVHADRALLSFSFASAPQFLGIALWRNFLICILVFFLLWLVFFILTFLDYILSAVWELGLVQNLFTFSLLTTILVAVFKALTAALAVRPGFIKLRFLFSFYDVWITFLGFGAGLATGISEFIGAIFFQLVLFPRVDKENYPLDRGFNSYTSMLLLVLHSFFAYSAVL
jgi:hypothetical protein